MAAKKKTTKRKAKKRGRPKQPTGRPCQLTPEMQDEICKYIRAGNYIETAAKLVGLSKVTIYDWLNRGNRTNEKKFVSFLNAVKKAEGEAEARDVALIGRAAMEQWQAAAWRLERKHYHRWGRKQMVEHSGPDGQPVKVQKIKIGDQEIEF